MCRQTVIILVNAIFLFSLILTTVGCGLLINVTSGQKATSSNAPIAVIADGPAKQVAPVLTAQFCADISGSYNRSYFEQAKQLVASWMDQLVRPAEAGATVYIQWITDDTYASSSTAMVIRIPAIPADPIHSTARFPELITTSSNPFAAPTATAEAKVEEARLTAMQRQLDNEYKQVTETQQVRLNRAQILVKRETDRLRSLEPSVENISSDIYGCIQKAAERFAAVNGKKVLVIASDMLRTGEQEATGKHQMPGVEVVIIDYPCEHAQACQDNITFWRSQLQQAHAASIRFYDPAESLTLGNIFLI